MRLTSEEQANKIRVTPSAAQLAALVSFWCSRQLMGPNAHEPSLDPFVIVQLVKLTYPLCVHFFDLQTGTAHMMQE